MKAKVKETNNKLYYQLDKPSKMNKEMKYNGLS